MKSISEKTSRFEEIIRVWSHRLSPITHAQNLSFLQTGISSHGVEWLLQHVLTHPTSRLTCIEKKQRTDYPRDPRLRVLEGTAINMIGLLQNETFDAACIGAWHDTKDLCNITRLVWRIVKPDGLLIVAAMDNGMQSSPLPGNFGFDMQDAAVLRYESQVILRKMDGDPASAVRFDA